MVIKEYPIIEEGIMDGFQFKQGTINGKKHHERIHRKRGETHCRRN